MKDRRKSVQPIGGLMPITLSLRALLKAGLISKSGITGNWEIKNDAWNLRPDEEKDIINEYRQELDC